MTSKCRRTAALLSITALAFTGVAATASADTGATEAHLTTIARDYLQGRATTLVDGGVARPAALTDRMADRATSVDAWVSGARDNLAKHGVRYGSAKVDLTVAKSDIKANTATLHLHEVTTLAPARGAQNPATSYAVDRVGTFQRTDRWRLDEQKLDAAANTLAPITERPDVARTGTAVVEQHDAAPGTRPVPAEVSERSSAAPAAKRDSVTAAASYCYSCMENYARQYWDHYNDNDYRAFPNDCTNFISQIMAAGGWTHVPGWYQSNDAWWYNWLNQSYPWAGAENWYWFARNSGRTAHVQYINDLLVTDVLQMDFQGTGEILDHTMLVTGRTSDNLFLTYHTSDHLDRPFWDIYYQYTGATYYTHRT